MQGLILLTGASGYIGGRLLRLLENEGRAVRCLARSPGNVAARAALGTQIAQGDVLDFGSLREAMQSVSAAYYMVHSMGSAGSFEERDREGARNFARAAEEAGVRRIIYLGGLGDERSEKLSPHLRSRHEVGEILRASTVIGSGSLSFEMVRNLTERLPLMICPKWVSTPAQPIAITDVLQYLRQSLDLDVEGDRVYEIGGADIVSYGDLMREYALQRDLTRLMIPVPVLNPRPVQPVAGAGDARVCARGAETGGQRAACHGGAGRFRAARLRYRADGRARCHRRSAAQRGPGDGRDALE